MELGVYLVDPYLLGPVLLTTTSLNPPRPICPLPPRPLPVLHPHSPATPDLSPAHLPFWCLWPVILKSMFS